MPPCSCHVRFFGSVMFPGHGQQLPSTKLTYPILSRHELESFHVPFPQVVYVSFLEGNFTIIYRESWVN